MLRLGHYQKKLFLPRSAYQKRHRALLIAIQQGTHVRFNFRALPIAIEPAPATGDFAKPEHLLNHFILSSF